MPHECTLGPTFCRMHSGPVTCLTLTDDQLVIGGSTFGNIAIADLSSGKRMGSVKSCFSPTGDFPKPWHCHITKLNN